MRRLTARTAIALLTFTIGVTFASAHLTLRRRARDGAAV
jgi:hypothetical protein